MPEVKEFFVVDRTGRREGEKYPYPTYFDYAAQTLYETWREIVFACDECGEVLEGVSTSWFTFWNVRLTASDRSLLADAIGEHLLDGCMSEKGTRQLLDIQRRLILMNQISQGVVPKETGQEA